MFEFCIPTKATIVPDGPDWLHEVKYDGYRLRLERDGNRVRLITRGGYDWTKRYPRIVGAARKVRQTQFVLDGEAVILGIDGISDFNARHSGKHIISPTVREHAGVVDKVVTLFGGKDASLRLVQRIEEGVVIR
jgi:ATP-dependent DNA ligase